MSKLRMPYVQTRRDAWIEIDLSAIEHNIKFIKNQINRDTKLMAVVKADAYGHDSTMVSPTLLASGVDMLGVASIDEGLQLRNSGIEAPIVVLGSAPEWAFVSAVQNNIQLSIFTEAHINACIDTFNKTGQRVEVHIKVDTGMHRIGVEYKKAPQFVQKALDTDCINIKGIFSHLACAENPKISLMQEKNWEEFLSKGGFSDQFLHIANTAGLLSYKNLHYKMVRAGIGIYGLLPDLHESIAKPDFKQVMSLKGRIAHIQEISKDEGISYSYSYRTNKPLTKIATIPLGYADGIPRALSNKIFGILNGKKVPQIGNITMDQMMFDITDIENSNVGDVITLLGNDGEEFISIDDWAEKIGTINYEIPCRLKLRLPRVFTRNQL
ncbi:MAG: alanine racemase [Candidatus Gastranaerophilales bacterium]|nr:alanine racemase [Candidatus Gastranaerophilales bacterium]